ncbi:MAG: peptidoglycan-binding protein [Eubacteriales bacterium]
MTQPGFPFIPATITVHLGAPTASAQNVTVTFPDYIKNVASSEIYPTWPEAALRANIYAQISFALNRVYTEYYRAQGYDFDITNSTSIDQSFVNGREVFENISEIVDEIFNSYLRRRGYVEPLFAAYCDGIRVQCNGLSQWGSVDLANAGATTYEILTNYYGDDIDIVSDVAIQDISESYPGVPLRLGSKGNEVRQIQIRLNRISANYPAIPKIYPTDGNFGQETYNAVVKFQEIFNLTPDGIVGPGTWYRIIYLYNGIKRLNEIVSEGLEYADVERQFSGTLELGDSGTDVAGFQYFLLLIGQYRDTIPVIQVTGVYDQQTKEAVEAFQQDYGLPVTGVVTLADWDQIYRAYSGIIESLPDSFFEEASRPYPGVVLRLGSEGGDVRQLQEYLNTLSGAIPQIPPVTVDGVFGPATEAAVIAFQEYDGLTPDGNVGAVTWEAIGEVYDDIIRGYFRSEGQYPGYDLGT